MDVNSDYIKVLANLVDMHGAVHSSTQKVIDDLQQDVARLRELLYSRDVDAERLVELRTLVWRKGTTIADMKRALR